MCERGFCFHLDFFFFTLDIFGLKLIKGNICAVLFTIFIQNVSKHIIQSNKNALVAVRKVPPHMLISIKSALNIRFIDLFLDNAHIQAATSLFFQFSHMLCHPCSPVSPHSSPHYTPL